jgi:hypothetical protein
VLQTVASLRIRSNGSAVSSAATARLRSGLIIKATPLRCTINRFITRASLISLYLAKEIAAAARQEPRLTTLTRKPAAMLDQPEN